MIKEHIVIAGVAVEVWRKSVKNFILVVYASDGRVRLSVPLGASAASIREVIMSRMDWIRARQRSSRARPVVAEPLMEDGAEHLFFGKAYPLRIREGKGRHELCFDRNLGIVLRVRPGSTAAARRRLLDRWYRAELSHRIQALLHTWQPIVGREAAEYRIKRMKTRWGTCNVLARRLWLNLKLVTLPEQCLELIVVHELVHLLEREHNEIFYGHMDRLLPDWRRRNELLK